MPKRPSLRDRVEKPGGREALFAPAAEPAAPAPRQRRDSPGSWEESNKRVTFYCPGELLAAIEREMGRSGRSKTRVITDAIKEHLR